MPTQLATGDKNLSSIPEREHKKLPCKKGQACKSPAHGMGRYRQKILTGYWFFALFWQCAVCAAHRDEVAGMLTSEKYMMTVNIARVFLEVFLNGKRDKKGRKFTKVRGGTGY